MHELAPCPFCGAKEIELGSVFYGEGVLTAAIHCANCGAYGPTASVYVEDVAEAKNQAINKWNHRQ
jgi:Lar family restriction alleviation protein